jgi:hypothetical protein
MLACALVVCSTSHQLLSFSTALLLLRCCQALESDPEQIVVGGSVGWANWASQDDRVMGGVSVSTMVASSGGEEAIFSGTLRLESNGGFTSVRTSFRTVDLRAFDGLRVKFFPSNRRLLLYSPPPIFRLPWAAKDLVALHPASVAGVRCRYLRVTDAGFEQYSAAMYIPSISEAGGSTNMSLVVPWTSFYRQVVLEPGVFIRFDRVESTESTSMDQVSFRQLTTAGAHLKDAQLTSMGLFLPFQPGKFEFRLHSIWATRAPTATAPLPIGELIAGLQDAQVGCAD